MGAFLVLFVAIITALMVAMVPVGQDVSQTSFVGDRPAVQAVAANLVEFHRAAVDFASRTENRNPSSTTWSFTYEDQTAVRCPTYASGTYPTNSVGGTCVAPTTEFRPPGFTNELYNWSVYYKSDGAGGSQDILVTYAANSADQPGGYLSADIANELSDYDLANESSWYWGVVTVGLTLSNGTTTLTMPSGFATTGVVAIATVIP